MGGCRVEFDCLKVCHGNLEFIAEIEKSESESESERRGRGRGGSEPRAETRTLPR